VGSLFSCSTYFRVSLVRQTRNSLTPAITAGGLAVLLFFSSRQFDKLPLSSTSFLVSFTSSSLPFSPAAFPAKIPSSELYRRRRHCSSDHRREKGRRHTAESKTAKHITEIAFTSQLKTTFSRSLKLQFLSKLEISFWPKRKPAFSSQLQTAFSSQLQIALSEKLQIAFVIRPDFHRGYRPHFHRSLRPPHFRRSP
jgi:hypothetical protein